MTRAVNVASSTSLALVTPTLGTPISGVATNLTGLPLTTGVTGTLPVANGGTGVTTSTGTGAVVLGTSPTLTTPILGTPTSGNLANCTGSNLAKAWVVYNGSTMAILASYGVSSITNMVSNIVVKITFSTAFTDTNFAYSGSCLVTNNNGFVSETNAYPRTTTTLTIATWYQYNATVASPLVAVMAFR